MIILMKKEKQRNLIYQNNLEIIKEKFFQKQKYRLFLDFFMKIKKLTKYFIVL